MRIEFQYVIASLAVWRVTHLLNAEDGPWRVWARLRRRAGVGFWGDLMDCFYCLSLWIAAPFAWWLGGGWTQWLLSWFAISGAAILLERATAPVQAAYIEDPPTSVKGEHA
ncbi:MAG TPA: hypothetical protein VKB88_18720 [Bryobacteraceae bacterium]|nr:hypothetical protein [Bryobacteraceae bacterium]